MTGKELKRLMTLQKMSPKELAEHLDTSYQVVYKWVNGDIPISLKNEYAILYLFEKLREDGKHD